MMKKEKRNEESKNAAYSPTEVGTMLEAIHKDIRIVAEGHSGLDRRLENLEVQVHGVSGRLDMLDLGFKAVNIKMDRVEDRMSKLAKDLSQTRDELKKDIQELGNRLSAVEIR